MKFGISEVFDSMEIAADLRKVLYFLSGMIIAGVFFSLIHWLGSVSGNESVSLILDILAVAAFFVVFASTNIIVSHIAYKDLTLGTKTSLSEALGFLKANLLSSMLAPAVIILAAVLVFALEYALFTTGKFAAFQIIFAILALPLILMNCFMIFSLITAYLMVFEIIAVDSSSLVQTVKRIYSLTKKTALQIIMLFSPVIIIGATVIFTAFAVLSLSGVAVFSLFGSASGIFMEMAATDIPVFATHTQIAGMIFSTMISLAFAFVISYLFVFIKVSSINIYLSLKERLK